MERAQEPGRLHWRTVGRTLGLLLVSLLGLAAPVSVGLLGGTMVGHDPLGLLVCMATGALVAVWWSRVVLTGAWWVRTGEWSWRRTSLLASIRRARGRAL